MNNRSIVPPPGINRVGTVGVIIRGKGQRSIDIVWVKIAQSQGLQLSGQRCDPASLEP
jgi:hypothetical protein